jgi:DNA-binding NarL/FixJ family response regulator
MKILLADDHVIVRNGIKVLLTGSIPFAEVTEVSDGAELLEQLPKQNWDIVISDITMPPGDSGLETIYKIREEFPRLPIIILSMHAVDQYAVRAIRAGASGYLHKGDASQDLIKAVNYVMSGKKYLTPEVADALAETLETGADERSLSNLSNRELEVFKMLASGKSVGDISRELDLSSNTISTFRIRIFEKMAFNNITELIKYAIDEKLI